MPSFKCYPISDPDTLWNYCPSYAGAIAFTVFFALATTAHITQAFIFRKPFALVLIMAGIWETLGYTMRILSVRDQNNSAFFTAQQLLIILAPLWINAFVYMLLGRMVHFYLANDRIFKIRARRITLLFVLCDIISFLIQATGGMMINSEYPASTQKIGMNTYMSGVGVQIGFICIFLTLAAQFHRLVKREDFYSCSSSSDLTSTPPKTAAQAIKLLYVIYAVLTLIVFRNIYRLIEFSIGVQSSITRHEWYTFVFDSVPMLLCLVCLNVFSSWTGVEGPKE